MTLDSKDNLKFEIRHVLFIDRGLLIDPALESDP
jgi:hypothetical protein